MIEDRRNRMLDFSEIIAREQIVHWEILHEQIVVLHAIQGFLQARVGIEADRRVEAFAELQHLQGQCYFRTAHLLLDLVEGTFDVQPEGHFLHGGARGRVTLEFSHLKIERLVAG